MAIKKNEVKFDLASYPWYLWMGVPKIGKTTTWTKLVELVTGSLDGGVLLSTGEENGYKAIEGVQAEELRYFDREPDDEIEDDDRGFIQACDDLVENRNTTWKNVKIVGVDTIDELYDIGTKQVFLEHKRTNDGKVCKSLNDALGGWGAGKARLINIVVEQLTRLNRAGYAVFVLAHTKVKNKEDIFTDKKYEVITNNLTDDLYGAIANKAQMIVNIVFERDIKGGTQKDKFGNVVAGSILETRRMMYFRDNGLVDAGGRFPGLPEKLELSAENFMEAFKIGVTNAKNKQLTDKQIEEAKQKEQKYLEKQRERLLLNENVGESEKKDLLVDAVKTLLKEKATDKDNAVKVKEKLKELEITIKELPNATLQALKELIIFLKSL